jgi:subtilisin family serine protease
MDLSTMAKKFSPKVSRIFVILLSVFFVMLCSACGASPGRLSGAELKAAHEKDVDAYPIAKNVSRWQGLWQKGEWIVSVGADPYRPVPQDLWKNQFAQGLVEAAGFSQGSAAFQNAMSLLLPQIQLQWLSLDFATLPQFLTQLDEPTLGFAHVKLRESESFLRLTNSFRAFDPGVSAEKARSALALWQLEGLENTRGVVWAEPNLVTPMNLKLMGQEAAEQPPEFRTSSFMADIFRRIGADKAYQWAADQKITPSEVHVAVLDTGVDFLHPDLKENMFRNPKEIPGNGVDDDGNKHIDDIYGIDATVENSRDLSVAPTPGPADLRGPGQACPTAVGVDNGGLTSNCGHGTHVAGIIAAKHGGNLSTLGVCPSCKIISIRVSERCLQPDTDAKGECVRPMSAYNPETQWEVDGGIADISQIRGLTYLFNLRQKDNSSRLITNVVNMSLGKYFRSRAMAYVIRNLERLNIVVVAAAGNDNTDTASYPAAYASVLSVCATGTEYHRGVYGKAIFSNFGDWVDICAPGVDILSTVPGRDSDGTGRFKEKTGTSQATPFVAGAVGYMLSIFKDSKSGAQIVKQLKSAARYNDLYSADYNQLYKACYASSQVCDHLLGSGFLDLGAAVQGIEQSQVDESNGRAVTSGCVMNSVATGKVPLLSATAWSSAPLVLVLLMLLIHLKKLIREALFR